MLREFSSAISHIYAAATNGSSWRHALGAIERLTHSGGAVVHVVPKGGAVTSLIGPSAEEHLPAADVEEWARELAPICPRLAAGAKWPTARYVVDQMILSEGEMDLDPVYDWYRDHGLRYFIGSPLFSTSTVDTFWSLQRTPRQGHAQATDIQLFELLKPHVARSLAIGQQLGSLRSFERFSSSVLFNVPQALFALDANGSIVFANAAAELLLRAADGLCCVDRKLRTRLPSEQHRLDSVIDDAATMNSRSDGWVRVSRGSGGPPYAAFISPLNSNEDDLLAVHTKVIVIVHDTADQRCADPRMLVEIFNLTDAEARLANAMSVGHSIESAAALLGVQPSTVRSQLKSVFRKTGVSRQQDLVRMLASLSQTGSMQPLAQDAG